MSYSGCAAQEVGLQELAPTPSSGCRFVEIPVVSSTAPPGGGAFLTCRCVAGNNARVLEVVRR